MAFTELRQYVIKPGQMDTWIKFFNDVILPFQVGKGMLITGIWKGETDDSVFVWTRRFESEAQREALYKAVYEDPHWKEKISPRVGELIDRPTIKVQRIVSTPLSPAQ
jgi:hypothetical protein